MKLSAEELTKITEAFNLSDLCPDCKRGRKLLTHIAALESEVELLHTALKCASLVIDCDCWGDRLCSYHQSLKTLEKHYSLAALDNLG